MSIVSDVLKELFSMFVADVWLTVSILLLTLLVAAITEGFPNQDPLWAGILLCAGCLAIIATTTIYARRAKKPLVRKM